MHLVRFSNGAPPGVQRKFSFQRKLISAELGYDKPGPYGFAATKVEIPLCDKLKRFKFKATYPTDDDPDWPVSDLKAPIIFFCHGFEIPNNFYKFYCERLATWGYVVVQYRQRFPIPFINDKDEVDLFSEMLHEVPEALKELPIRCDDKSVAIAGHSRGGKIAVLVRMKYHSQVHTAYMIDPVDGVSCFAQPGTHGYPDAVHLMKHLPSKLAAGIAGNECSILVQSKYNYTHFWDQMDKNKSSSAKLEKANHLSFCSCSSGGKFLPIAEGADRVSDNNAEVVEPTCTLLVHWMESKIATPPASSPQAKAALEKAFHGWLTRNEQLGLVIPLKP